MPDIVLIQGSLNPDSKTSILINETAQQLKTRGADSQVLDLRDLEMQFCDGRTLKEYNSDMQSAYSLMESAKAYVFGMPVYCYSVSGVLKNFIDITSGAMESRPKYAGILCNMGGASSFMACADLEKILSFESHVMTVQPIPFAVYSDFDSGQLTSGKVRSKIQAMVDRLLELCK